MPRKPTPEPTPEQLRTVNATRARNHMSVEVKAQAKAAAEVAIGAKGADMEAIQQRMIALLGEKKTPDAVATAMGWDSAGLALFLNANRTWATQQWFPMVTQVAKSAKLQTKIDRAKPARPELVALGSTTWTDEMRKRLVEAYVDTGDLLKAQEIIGVTPSQFNTEVDNNPEFAERIKAAKKQASRTLELRATAEALNGNDKLLSLILRKDEDDAGVSQLTDDQLARRLDSFLARVRGRIDAGRTGADDAGGKARPPGDAGGDGDSAPA